MDTATDAHHEKADAVSTVDRALSILCAFGANDQSLSLAELSRRTGLYKSTILRHLQSLERRSFMIRATNGNYRLGPMLLQLGNAYLKGFNLEGVLLPLLESLALETEESASFFVVEGGSRRCLYRVDSKQQVRHAVEVGVPLDLRVGASGKVFQTFSDQSGKAINVLVKQLPCVAAGSAPLDISSISCPVFGADYRLLGAISVAGPEFRFNDECRRMAAPILIDVSRKLTKFMGGASTIFD